MAHHQQYRGSYGYEDPYSAARGQQSFPQQQDPFSNDAYPASGGMYPPQQQAHHQQPYATNYAHLSHDDLDDYGIPKEQQGYGATRATGIARDQNNPYAAGYKGQGSSKKKWWIIGGVVLVLIAIIGGIVGWRVSASNDDSPSSSSGSSSGGMQYLSGTANVVKFNRDDMSDFEKDSSLHQSFWGLTYTPFLSQEPWCGVTLANVTEDIAQMSQLTTRLRMYGSACNQSQIVLQAIQDTKVNMSVWLGAYIGPNTTVNEEQKQWTLDALELFGPDRVEGVVIGNEYLLNAVDKPTAIQTILGHVTDFKSRLAALNLPKTIPVGTGDAGSEIDPTLVAGIDFFMANNHAFFGGVPVEQAAGWTWEFTETNNVPVIEAASADVGLFIAETGWPTGSMTPENATYEGAVAGVEQLQTFLDTYVCAANANGSAYFFFSPYDESWKDQFGGVEPYWGIMDGDKRLKAVTLPNCQAA